MTAKKIYVYGFIPTSELNNDTFPEHEGFDEAENLYPLTFDSITAVVSKLDPDSYTEEIIEDKINNDLAWLQKKAFHHHEVLMMLNKLYTVIPLSFCTIYNSEERVNETASSQASDLEDSFNEIAGREEWNLKIYYDEDKLKEEVNANNPVMQEKRDEIEKLSPGKQFFEKKKLDKLAEKEMEKELNTICEAVHHDLSELAVRADVKKLLGKDATGRKDAMSWNSVYLLEKPDVDDFINTVTEKEKELNQSGLKMEATGPWPAYHFSNLQKAEK
ncbi:Gas vesicle synthesis protein GvpL/GvpF [Lentibacillus persicus]|uniref:Gas vesicle synthesis protein GvpL/GvpF n=1 Tax=Lentibacillus persicus TaxID=640948 RepID=A0A1I1S6T3_9BACI|nr:GvpL/GvpF family gas vesicle protein [Lentibacillus persicus]SFD40288.1 Gas vesicle synthesis protein GvpL/GvpF [Lentibacillus persicus]